MKHFDPDSIIDPNGTCSTEAELTTCILFTRHLPPTSPHLSLPTQAASRRAQSLKSGSDGTTFAGFGGDDSDESDENDGDDDESDDESDDEDNYEKPLKTSYAGDTADDKKTKGAVWEGEGGGLEE